jgi:hypothetical protein
VHRFDQALEQLLALLQADAAMLEAFEELVDRKPKIADRIPVSIQTDPSGGVRVARQPPDLLGQLIDGTILALLPKE